jgi:predicted nucleic acid-binding protein
MYRGACRSDDRERHLAIVEDRVLPNITVLPHDIAVARVYGRVFAELADMNALLDDADLQIAATAVHHRLTLITGNLRHFARVPGLQIDRVLAGTRRA